MQGIVWILFFYLLGCVVSALTGNFIPGSVVGMLLLFGALSAGWIKPWRMKRAAGFMLDNMMLFFIPVGVGLIVSYSLVSKYLTAILVASIVSTVLVIIVVGTVAQRLENKHKTESDPDSPPGGTEPPASTSPCAATTATTATASTAATTATAANTSDAPPTSLPTPINPQPAESPEKAADHE